MILFTNVGGQWILKSIDMLNAATSKNNASIVTTEVTITEAVMAGSGPPSIARKSDISGARATSNFGFVVQIVGGCSPLLLVALL